MLLTRGNLLTLAIALDEQLARLAFEALLVAHLETADADLLGPVHTPQDRPRQITGRIDATGLLFKGDTVELQLAGRIGGGLIETTGEDHVPVATLQPGRERGRIEALHRRALREHGGQLGARARCVGDGLWISHDAPLPHAHRHRHAVPVDEVTAIRGQEGGADALLLAQLDHRLRMADLEAYGLREHPAEREGPCPHQEREASARTAASPLGANRDRAVPAC